MPLFRCSKCGCYENTALSNYWELGAPKGVMDPALCSGCDPKTAKWHGEFEQLPATGMLVDKDGFLYHDAMEARALNSLQDVVGKIKPDGQVDPKWR